MILEIVNINQSWVPFYTAAGNPIDNSLSVKTKEWIDKLVTDLGQMELSVGMIIDYNNQFGTALKLQILSIEDNQLEISEPKGKIDLDELTKEMDNLDIQDIKLKLSQHIQAHSESVFKKQSDELYERLDLYFNYHHLGIKQKQTFLLRGHKRCGKDYLVKRISFLLQTPIIYFNVHQETAHLHHYSQSTASPTSSPLSRIIDLAQLSGPCILLVSGMEAFDTEINWKDFDLTAILESFFTQLKKIQGFQIIVIACCSESAKLPNNFSDFGEIELPLLDFQGRHSVLEGYSLAEDLKKQLAKATVGYNAGDLALLVGRVLFENRDRDFQLNSASFDEFRSLIYLNQVTHEFQTEKLDVSWEDIAGYSEIKKKLQQLVTWPIENPLVYERFGIKPPSGILLYGPSGCSQIYSKYLGDSEYQIRKIFQTAKNSSPCILFIDDLDAVASRREWSEDGAGGVNERVLSSLLNEMDGISGLSGVIVVGCTNRPHQLDDALTRPGRLDFHFYISLPTVEDRRDIIRMLSNKSKSALTPEQIDYLVSVTENYTPSDLKVMFREAGILALQDDLEMDCIKYDYVLKALANVLSVKNPGGYWLPACAVDLKQFEEFAGKNKK
ncbi:hypothetical protein HDV01_000159 [Terramyces sp. JEL0728]|nr:hypothetical protein HDV01_000159 [Terramyces sp. JEL0728]